MDEVRAERLISQYGDNALFIIIHKWPNSPEYKKHPELLPNVELLVRKDCTVKVPQQQFFVQIRCALLSTLRVFVCAQVCDVNIFHTWREREKRVRFSKQPCKVL